MIKTGFETSGIHPLDRNIKRLNVIKLKGTFERNGKTK